MPPDQIFWLLEGYSEISNRGLNGYEFKWTNSGVVKTATIEKNEDLTFCVKCAKGIVAPDKYPTKASYNGLLNAAANSYILVGDLIYIADIKADFKQNISFQIKQIKRDGKIINTLNGKWFNYKKDYFN